MQKPNIPTLVLIVEADASVQESIVQALAAPHRVLMRTSSLDQARSAMAGIIPDMIILDLHLPDGSGMELLPSISRRHHLHGATVFMLCDDRALSTRVSVFASGARRCFLKPLDTHDLLDSVLALEQRMQSRGATRREGSGHANAAVSC